MSFWKALEHDLAIVGRDALALAPVAGVIIGMVNPAAGALFTGITGRLTSSILAAEQTIKEEKSGALRAQTVVSDFENALSLASEISGRQYTYDKVALQAAIDGQVAALNGFAALKSSLKET